VKEMKWNESLKAIRKERKKTQKEIATELQVSQALVSAWELGVNKPDIDNLFKLARYYQVSLDYLVSFTPKEKE
jgi:transcriptional regulator with XRE-family HTH domain